MTPNPRPSKEAIPRRAILVVIALALSTSGCAELYKDAGQSFAKGHDAGATLVESAVDPYTRVERTRLAEAYWISAGGRLPFDHFVCAGRGALANQQAAIKSLAAYSKQIEQLTDAPDRNIGALWQSLTSKNPDALEAPQAQTAIEAECRSRVRALLALSATDIEQRRITTEFAPAAVMAIPALLRALEAVATNVLALADEAKRGEALKQYVRGSSEAVDEVLTTLMRPDATLNPLCRRQPDNAICQPYRSKELPVTAIDGAFIRRQWASLRLPLRRFEALEATLPIQGTAAARESLLLRAGRVQGSLAEFDGLEQMPPPSLVVAAMRQAQDDLERLAAGDLTAEEYWSLAMGFAEAMKDIVDSVQNVEKQVQSTRAAFD